MILNVDQENVFDELEQFYADPSRQVIVVVGPGGSGKSRSVVEFLKEFYKLAQPVCLTAPTNKAVGVLKDFASEVGRYMPTSTIFKLLGLVVGADGEEKTTFSAHDGNLDRYKTVVIDEGSMASRTLCGKLQDKLEENPEVKIIVMMDKCQLPPVNERQSYIYEMGKVVELSIDMRSGNGPLLQAKRAVRDIVMERLNGNNSKAIQYQFSTDLDEEGSGTHLLVGKHFETAMLDMFDTEQYQADPNFVRALAWTNKEVERLNRLIRARIYGKECEAYVTGERICILTPVRDDNDEPVFDTDEEVEVVSLTVTDYVDYTDQDATDESRKTYKVFRAELKKSNGTLKMVHLLHPDSERKFKRRLEFIADKCREKKRPWSQFWAAKEEMFINARPAHALTVHKSQGQTFGCTFLNMKDVMKNHNPLERAQLVYVGTSRPTTDLVVNLKTFH